MTNFTKLCTHHLGTRKTRKKKGREMKRIETNKRGDVKILNDTNTQKFSETIKKKKKKKGKKHWPFFFMVWYYVYREREISK